MAKEEEITKKEAKEAKEAEELSEMKSSVKKAFVKDTPAEKSSVKKISASAKRILPPKSVAKSKPATKTKYDTEFVGEAAAKIKENESAVTNILADMDDEVTFVLEKIAGVASRRVVVSIPEGSDLLVSSVGMHLLADYADGEKKLLVIATNDISGRNMAKLAGLAAVDSTADVDENTWLDAENVKRIRQEDEARKEAEQAASRAHIPPMVEKTGLVNKDFHDNITDSDARVREEQAGDIAGTGAATEKDVGSVSEDETVPQEEQKSPMNLGRERESIELGERKLLEEDARVQEEPVERKVSVGGFEMTIDDGVKRSGAAAFSRPIGKVMSVPKPEQTESRGLIGRDFSSYEVLIGRPAIPADKTGESGPVNFEGATSIDGSGLVKMVKVVIGKLPVIGVLGAKKATLSVAAVPAGMARRKLKKILIPVGVAALFTAAGGYWYLPEVIVELNIESIPVSYEGEIIAKLTAEGVNIDDAVVPARSEVVTNNGSESASATGIASRGEKASGDVTIYNKTDDDITVASGTVLSNGGLGFVLQGAVTVPKRPDPIGMGSVSGSIVAQEQGSEYNLEAGTTFSVGSVALSELSATNPSVFTGGTSEEYRVVSQNDIDTAAGKIRKRLYAESKTELLEALNGSKWVFVESSIKNEPDGGVTSDVPAGAEQDSVNVDVKTKSTALYYDGRALDTLVADLLMKDFGDTDLESVELSEDITKEITVKSAVVADGEIVLTVKITGYVMPILDKDAVADSLHGKPWVEGIADLKKMDYVSGEPSVDFSPAWFPGFAKRFPSRKGRISVVIKNVTPKVEEDSSDGGGE